MHTAEIFRTAALPDTVIEKTELVPAASMEPDQGEFLRVRLRSTPGRGSLIYSEVWLPKGWNGIYVGTGNGGMAGGIARGSLMQYVKQGYAAANTDMGTSRGWQSGVGNPDVWADFGWRATWLMTVCAKELIRLYYGTPPTYSYFVGHSTGGQQALAMAQRFPDLHDGIVSGAPANNRTHLHTYFVWNYVHCRPEGEEFLFDEAELRAVTACAVEMHQASGDGQQGDGFISLPSADEAAIDELLARIARRNPAFTCRQLDALRALYMGPINPRTGERIYNGLPMGTEGGGAGALLKCAPTEIPHYYPFRWTFGGDYSAYSFDFDQDMETVDRVLGGDMNANNADLRPFRDHGGKLLMSTGSADPIVPHPDAMRYIDRVAAHAGGHAAAAEFARWFLIPGKDHGAGGATQEIWANADGGSQLDALRRWREDGVAPDALWAVAWNGGKWEKGVRFVRRVPMYDGTNCGACPPVCGDGYLL